MYSPCVDDYVIWHTTPTPLQGWVYFVDARYCTIEISVKPKVDDLFPAHKKTHCCVLCFHENWDQLEFIKDRRND